MKCLICEKESWRSVFCRLCRETKGNATAIFVQNKKKLQELLYKQFDEQRLGKFALYTKNMIQYWKIMNDFRMKKFKYLLNLDEDLFWDWNSLKEK